MRQDDLRDLREQRKRIHNDMLALVDQAEKEKRDFNAEDQTAYEKMVEEFEGLERRIRRGAQQAAFAKDIEPRKQCPGCRSTRRLPTRSSSIGCRTASNVYRMLPSTGRPGITG